MSLFLRNIINRHQQAGDNLKNTNIVQPRPLSRFENFIDKSESFIQQDEEMESVSGKNLPHTDTDIADTDIADKPFSDTDKLLGNQTLEYEASPLRKDFPLENINIEQPKNESIHSNKKPKSAGEKTLLTQSDRQNNKVEISKDKFETLKNKSQKYFKKQTPDMENKKNNVTKSTELFSLTEQLEESIHDVVSTNNNDDKTDTSKHIENSHQVKHKTPQISLFKNSSWLTEVQSKLNILNQTTNSPTITERTINVTIGRVEVKAVQPIAPTKRKDKSKPSGVMTLNEYVKKRNSEIS